ncbi:MAG: hypothetical protein P794_05260 [Epsilonproteobacteria bacterium (ex Lamellibrachia satsuma)]|nr:MAG: hypothetical protein P794_05260 [Epsilonproteobacteria bacterium (ex Lamellibrachia satsuma)]
MNIIKTILLVSLCATMAISAEIDISAQIKQLKNAKKSEKYIIMNKIKMQIAKLNSEQRAKAISQLRGAMFGSGSSMQMPQMPVPSLANPMQGMPQMPVPPVIGNMPIPTPPAMMSVPNLQTPKGGQ